MFDDPKKELKRLEEELLAEEYEDLDQEEYEQLEQYQQIPIYRNYANGYGLDAEDTEAFDEDTALFVDEKEERRRKRDMRGMVFMAVLDLLLIAGLIGWWLAWRR